MTPETRNTIDDHFISAAEGLDEIAKLAEVVQISREDSNLLSKGTMLVTASIAKVQEINLAKSAGPAIVAIEQMKYISEMLRQMEVDLPARQLTDEERCAFLNYHEQAAASMKGITTGILAEILQVSPGNVDKNINEPQKPYIMEITLN